MVRVSQEVAACHYSVRVVSKFVHRGGSHGGRLCRFILFFQFIAGLLEIAVVMGLNLVGTIPTLDIGFGGAVRPLVVVPGGLAVFVALSPSHSDGECPRSGYRSRLFRISIAKGLLDRRPGSGPAIRKMSNLKCPH